MFFHKFKLTVFFVGLNFLIFGQENWLRKAIADSTHTIRIKGRGLLETQAVSMAMANKFIYGGFINEEIKNKSLAKHKAQNLVESAMVFEIDYKSPVGNKNNFFGINYAYEQLLLANYNKDLFELIFFGNANLSHARFKQSQFTSLNFHTLGLSYGMSHQNDKSLLQWQISPKFIALNNFSAISFTDFSVITSELGDEITVTGEYESNFLDKNSFGYGMDFSVYYQIQKWEFNFNTHNVAWVNTHMENSNFNGTYDFQGIAINDLFNLEENNPSFNDLTDSVLTNSKTKSRILLPFQLNLQAQYAFFTNFRVFGKVKQVYFTQFTPQNTLGFLHDTGWIEWGVDVSYGGATNWIGGLFLAVDLAQFQLQIATNSLGGFISPSNNYAQSLMVNLLYKF